MATLTDPHPQLTALSNHVDTLLRDYEEFYIRQDYPGVHGYVLQLKTNLLVHIKYTRKNVFIPHSVYQGTSMTVLPNKYFMDEWLKNARASAKLFISEKSEYLSEKLVAGEWQTWKRKFNQWYYYDKKRGVIIGELKEVKE